MADAGDLKSPVATRAGSNPAPGTNFGFRRQRRLSGWGRLGCRLVRADMIKRGMPYRFLLAILLCFACSKSEAPPPAATEAEQEPAVLPKVAADPSPAFPSVELVTAGERPRRVLRREKLS
jgi:hypothetical protein